MGTGGPRKRAPPDGAALFFFFLHFSLLGSYSGEPMRRRPRENIIWSSCVATVGERCDGRRSSSIYQDMIGRLRFTQFRRQLFHNPRWAIAVGGGERAGAWGLRDGSGRTGRRADPVTPAHSHTRLWGEIASPQRATHLRTAPPVLFRSRKWIRFVERGSGRREGGGWGCQAQGPVPFNIQPVFYNVNSDCLIRPTGPPARRNKR